MRLLFRSILLLAAATASLHAGAPDPGAAKLLTLTFYISGVECVACVDTVCRGISERKGVKDVAMVQSLDSYANISFDPALISPQQIAQIIYEAPPLHGKPYEATLRLHIPEYASGDNASRVDALFARFKDQITVDTVDKAKGEFVVYFEAIDEDEKKPAAQGWDFAKFIAALQAPTPKGAGVKVTVEEEK